MLSPRRYLAITRKELRHITRDARILFLVTVSPAFLLVVLAYLFAVDLGSVGLVWLDYDHSQQSRAYLQRITAGGDFTALGSARDYEQVEAALLAGRADLAVVVPPGFGADLTAGRSAQVQAIIDGSDAISAQRTLGNLASRTGNYSATLSGRTMPLQVRTRAWYNGNLNSLWSMVPGLMAIVLSLPALALALGIKREEELGTLEGLIATPVRGAEYQLGKLTAYVLSGLVSATLAALVATHWFRVPIRGSFALYLLLAAEFFLASMSISLVIARFVTSQQTAMLLVLLVFFVPGFFIAGLISPVDTSSTGATLTAYALPVTHFMAISRGIFLKGLGLAQMRPQVELLALQAIVSLAMSLSIFRKRIG